MRPKRTLIGGKIVTTDLKQESKKMEDKLNQLKALIQKQKDQRNQTQRFGIAKQKIKQQKKVIESEIEKFLKEIGLPQYYDNLVKNGIDTLDILYDVKKEEYQQIGVLKGHAIKIMKYLKDNKVKVSNNFVQSKEQELDIVNNTQHKISQNQNATVSKQLTIKPQIPKISYTFDQCQTQPYILNQRPRNFCTKCFKQYEVSQKQGFCSTKCSISYQQQNLIKCQQCSKISSRWDCFKIQDMFFCSQDCLNQQVDKFQQQIQKYQQLEIKEQNIFWNEFGNKDENNLVNTQQLDQIANMLQDLQ